MSNEIKKVEGFSPDVLVKVMKEAYGTTKQCREALYNKLIPTYGRE